VIERRLHPVAFEKGLIGLSIALLAGLSLVIFSASPIINASVKAQVQTLQISVLVLAAATITIVGAVAALKKGL
jgi:hypothetical protein